MSLLVPNEGEVRLLTNALTQYEDVYLKLFVSNTTPAEGDTAVTYTEMSTHGYAAKTLAKGSWSVANVAGVTTASYAQQTWTFTAAAAVIVYGYFVVGVTSGKVYWAEKFSTGQSVENTGDQISVTPLFTGE